MLISRITLYIKAAILWFLSFFGHKSKELPKPEISVLEAPFRSKNSLQNPMKFSRTMSTPKAGLMRSKQPDLIQ